MPTTHLLYLHGFRSAPASTKARKMQQRVESFPAVTWCCPQLPASPAEAMALIERSVKGWPRASMAVVGSSLGGFYAAVLAEKWGCKAALLNPAVDPARDLGAYIGTVSSWHDPQESFEFRAEYIDELREMAPAAFRQPERYYTLIAKGDEVLDWREMTARYPAAHGELLEGSDHAIDEFDDHIEELLRFLDLAR